MCSLAFLYHFLIKYKKRLRCQRCIDGFCFSCMQLSQKTKERYDSTIADSFHHEQNQSAGAGAAKQPLPASWIYSH